MSTWRALNCCKKPFTFDPCLGDSLAQDIFCEAQNLEFQILLEHLPRFHVYNTTSLSQDNDNATTTTEEEADAISRQAWAKNHEKQENVDDGEQAVPILFNPPSIGVTSSSAQATAASDSSLWNMRAFYVQLAAEWWGSDRLEELSNCPNTADGNLFHGAYFIRRAWDARGSGTADTVWESDYEDFYRGLERALAFLSQAAEQDPLDPTPWALMITCARGLELDTRIAQEYFEAALHLDPHNQLAHVNYLTFLCEKWHGTHDEMYAFVRQTMQSVPADSPLQMLLLLAHLEFFLYETSFDAGIEAIGYKFLYDQEMREEVVRMCHTALLAPKTDDLEVAGGGRRRQLLPCDYFWYNVASCWLYIVHSHCWVYDIVTRSDYGGQRVLFDTTQALLDQIYPHLTTAPWNMSVANPMIHYTLCKYKS